jgi:hypothetical protein
MSSKNELRVLLIDLLSGQSLNDFLGGTRVPQTWDESGGSLALTESRCDICGCSVTGAVVGLALEVLK